jgi:hypothetical protein
VINLCQTKSDNINQMIATLLIFLGNLEMGSHLKTD